MIQPQPTLLQSRVVPFGAKKSSKDTVNSMGRSTSAAPTTDDASQNFTQNNFKD